MQGNNIFSHQITQHEFPPTLPVLCELINEISASANLDSLMSPVDF